MTRPWSRNVSGLGLSLILGLTVCVVPAQAGLFGLCQLIANFDNPDMGYCYGVGPWGSGSVYVWGPPDYGLARYRSGQISQFGLDRSLRRQEVISDRLWEETRRASRSVQDRSRDSQMNWMHQMTGVAPVWAVQPIRQTRLEQQEPVLPVTLGAVDWKDGRIQWPNLLAIDQFAALRGTVEKEFSTLAKPEGDAQADRTRLLRSIESLREELKGIGNRVRAHQFLVSLRFLERLEEEVYSR